MDTIYFFTNEVKLKEILKSLNITVNKQTCYYLFDAYKKKPFTKQDLERSIKTIHFILNNNIKTYGSNRNLAILLLQENHLNIENITFFTILINYLKNNDLLFKT